VAQVVRSVFGRAVAMKEFEAHGSTFTPSTEKYPGATKKHCAALVAPVVLVLVPIAHAVQLVAVALRRVVSENVPCWHRTATAELKK
jgi:hypothetical protein